MEALHLLIVSSVIIFDLFGLSSQSENPGDARLPGGASSSGRLDSRSGTASSSRSRSRTSSQRVHDVSQDGRNEPQNENQTPRHQRRRTGANEISNQAPVPTSGASSSGIRHVHTVMPGFTIEHHGYHHAGPDDIHLIHFAPLSSPAAVTNPPETATEPVEIHDRNEIFNLAKFDLGQILRFQGWLYIIDTTTPIGNDRKLRQLTAAEHTIYMMINARNPMNPKRYRIPRVREPYDHILRKGDDGRLKKVGTINERGVNVSLQNRKMALKDGDLLVRGVGRDEETGKPVFKSMALAWNSMWISGELRPLALG